MALLDWIFVFFGAAIALTGAWIQLCPERVIPGQRGPGQPGPGRSLDRSLDRSPDWQLDPAARAQIRRLGACFLFMGTFFTLQMTTDLIRRPWWIGSLSGLVAAIAAVTLVYGRVRRQQRRGRRILQQSPLAEKALELR
jgi:uncharacterized membrane protein HdeD (DUF308 family)